MTLFFLIFTFFHLSRSNADSWQTNCTESSNGAIGKFIENPTAVLTPTSDSQIFRDACGKLLAVMSSQTSTPTINIQTLTSEYGLYPAGNNSSSVPVLHSNPSATRKLYLDFDGYTFPNDSKDTAWIGYFGGLAQLGATIPGLDLDGNPNSFSQSEQVYITETWLSVSEDFSAFEIDVTTEDPGVAGLTRTTVNDVNFGVTAVVSSAANWSAKCGCGGVAYVASINVNPTTAGISLNPYGVNFNFNKFNNNFNNFVSARDLAGIISHESGHSVGLGHDGTTSVEYYGGHSNGIWAPIMGGSYGAAVSHWSKNEYSNGKLTSLQGWVDFDSGWGWYWGNVNVPENRNDFEIITQNNIPLKSDDYGNNINSAASLNKPRVTLNGIVGPNQDIDFFKFTVASSQLISVSAAPIAKNPNLDILLKIYNSEGQFITSFDPQVSRGVDYYPVGMDATFSRREFSAGTYYLSVQGASWGNPLNTGYSDFGSVGQYTLDFTIHLSAQATLRITNVNKEFAVGDEVQLSTSGGSGTGAISFGVSGQNCVLAGDKLSATAGAICSVVATKDSDNTFSEISSSRQIFTFREAQQAISITNTNLSNAVGFAVTLTFNGGTGTGAVTYSLSSPNPLCRVRNTFVSASSPTTCSVVVTKAASGLYAQKTSLPVIFTFKGAQAAISISNLNTSVPIGNEVTLSVVGGSGTGDLSFSVTGINCDLVGNKLTANSATSCSVTATKASDNLYAEVSSVPKVFIFLQDQDELIISNQSTTSPIGTQVTLTTTGGSGTGAVTFSLSAENPLCSILNDKLTAAQPTQCSVLATKASQGLFASKNSTAVVFSFKGPQSALRITNSSRTNNVGTEVSLTTTGGSGTGAITFSNVGENCNITGDKLTATTGSSCVVTATKAADATFAPVVSSPLTFIFLGQQNALSISNETRSGTVGTRLALTTSGGSGTGAITFQLSAANPSCRISRNFLSATSGTTCEIFARKASQGFFQQAVSDSVIFTFKGPQSALAISNVIATYSVGNEVILTTTGGSGTGVVTFQVSGSNCSIVAGKLTAVTSAICSVVATKASDNTFSETTSAAKVFKFLEEQANLSVSNQITIFAVGTTVSLTTQGGSGEGAVTFTLDPPNPTCEINGNSLTASQPTECAIKATKAATGLYNGKSSDAKYFYFKGSQQVLRITNVIRTVSVGIQLPIITSGGSGTGDISFTVTGANCSINNGVLSATDRTTCLVVATKGEDTLYYAVNSAQFSFTFLLDQAELSITNNATTNAINQWVTLTSAGGSGTGIITYSLSERNRSCRIEKNRLMALTPTTCKIKATKASSGFYASKESAVVNFIFT